MAPYRALPVLAALAAALVAAASPARAAEPVMVQCGQQYQAAKAAGTLNGLDWNQYRTECAARLKAQPTVAAPAAAATAPTPQPVTPVAAPAPGGGRAAMLLREKQCGAEWRSQKAALVAATPGLTWPRYWSQCNTRLKQAGR